MPAGSPRGRHRPVDDRILGVFAQPPKRVYSRDEAIDTHADVAFVQDRLGHTNVQNAIIYMRYTTVTRDAQTRQLFASHRVV